MENNVSLENWQELITKCLNRKIKDEKFWKPLEGSILDLVPFSILCVPQKKNPWLNTTVGQLLLQLF